MQVFLYRMADQNPHLFVSIEMSVLIARSVHCPHTSTRLNYRHYQHVAKLSGMFFSKYVNTSFDAAVVPEK